MRYLILLFTLISFNLFGQGIEPSSVQPSPYLHGILKAVTPIVDEFTGDTNYLYVHSDSLEIVNGPDSTIVQNSYGTIITESPANTWNVKVDSSKYATQYDLTLIAGGGGTVSSVDGSGGTGISVTGGPITTTGTLTITNTAPDQTVTITDGGITDVTGTYPNFTITSTEVDGSVTNEIQSLSLLDSINRVFRLQISGGNIVQFKDLDTNSGGTVTNIATAGPITGGPITATGTIGLDTTSATGAATQYDLTLKQNTLVSGTNIKTVNSNSLLGSGNVSVGTVTSITAVAPLTGGAITGSGSIGVDTTSTTGLATQYDILGLGGLSGGGTINYIPKWNTSTSLNNSLMYQSGQSLNVAYDDNSFSRGFVLQNTNTGSFAINGLSYKNSAGSTVANIEYYPTNYANSSIADFASVNTLGSTSGILFNTNAAGGDGASSGNIIFKTGGNTNPAIFIKGSDGSGYVGLGNTSPQKSLDVTGTLRVSSLDTDLTAPTTSGTTKMLIGDGNGDVSFANIPDADQTVVINEGGIVDVTGTYPTFTVSATEVDGSVTNEIQYLSLLDSVNRVFRLQLSDGNTVKFQDTDTNSGGTVTSITANAPLTGGTITTSGSIGVDTTSSTGLATQYDLTTISGGTTDLSISGTSSPLTLNSSTGTDVTFTQGTGITLAGSSGNVTITNSSADQSITNEGQLSVGAGTASTSIINSNTSGSGAITLSEGSGIDISESGNTITIANTGMTSLNGLSGTSQAFTWDASGSDFGISSTGFTHTFSLPTASAANRGALSTSDWTTFNNKMGGTGSTNKVPYFTSSNALSFNSNFHWDNSNGRLGVGTASPQTVMHVAGDATSGNVLLMQNKQAMATSLISQQILSIGSGSGYSSTERYYALKNTATSGSASDFSIGYWNGGSETSRFKINSTGNVQIPFLAGSGTRMVITDGSGWLDYQTIPTGTVSSIATNNGITGGTITTSGTIGLTGQALALHNLGTNGIVARTSSGAFSARTLTQSTGISITNGDGVSGNPTITAVSSSYSDLTKPTAIASQTYNTTYRKIDFDTQGGNMTASSGNDDITVNANGTYLVTYSGSFYMSSSGNMAITLYVDGSATGYGLSQSQMTHNSTDYYTFSKTFVVALSSGDVLDVRFAKQSGTDGNVTFLSPSFVVQRIL